MDSTEYKPPICLTGGEQTYASADEGSLQETIDLTSEDPAELLAVDQDTVDQPAFNQAVVKHEMVDQPAVDQEPVHQAPVKHEMVDQEEYDEQEGDQDMHEVDRCAADTAAGSSGAVTPAASNGGSKLQLAGKRKDPPTPTSSSSPEATSPPDQAAPDHFTAAAELHCRSKALKKATGSFGGLEYGSRPAKKQLLLLPNRSSSSPDAATPSAHNPTVVGAPTACDKLQQEADLDSQASPMPGSAAMKLQRLLNHSSSPKAVMTPDSHMNAAESPAVPGSAALKLQPLQLLPGCDEAAACAGRNAFELHDGNKVKEIAEAAAAAAAAAQAVAAAARAEGLKAVAAAAEQAAAAAKQAAEEAQKAAAEAEQAAAAGVESMTAAAEAAAAAAEGVAAPVAPLLEAVPAVKPKPWTLAYWFGTSN